MTMADLATAAPDGSWQWVAQQVGLVLTEQGKQAVQLGVISEQLRAVTDHEDRIRANTAELAELRSQHTADMAALRAAASVTRDTWARAFALVAAAAAAADIVTRLTAARGH